MASRTGPGTRRTFFRDVGSNRAVELGRYAAVIHLRPPTENHGYDHSNPLRIETAREAAAIDARIDLAWNGHPRRAFVGSEAVFLDKVSKVIALIQEQIPPCCRPVQARR